MDPLPARERGCDTMSWTGVPCFRYSQSEGRGSYSPWFPRVTAMGGDQEAQAKQERREYEDEEGEEEEPCGRGY